MQRRFNYTKRKRIKSSDVRFSITEEEGQAPIFYADIELDEYGLPSDAKVWIEAYDRNALMRFPFGTAGAPRSETDTTLSDFAGTDSYYFRVKVVDRRNRHRLFAVADSLSPVRHDDDEAAKSLLRVATRDLHSVPWILEFPTADHPLLVINNRIDAGKSLARSDQFFLALVLPAILEQILRHILLEDGYLPAAEPQDDDMWKEAWLEFAGNLPGNSALPIDAQLPREERERWIADARKGFCVETNAINCVRRALGELE